MQGQHLAQLKASKNTKKAGQRRAFFYASLILISVLLPDAMRVANAETSVSSKRSLSACPAIDIQAPGTEKVRVEHVVDGDTVRLTDGRKIRLIGLNTPEIASRQRLKPEMGAVNAKQRLAEWVLDKSVYLRVGEQAKDKYGRVLAHLYTDDGQSIEALMLVAGMGFRIAVPPNLQHQRCFQEVEAIARSEQRGVWAMAEHKALQHLSAQGFSGGFARVRAKVVRIDKSRHAWWLELSNDLVLRITQRHWQYFSFAELNKLLDHEIEVRGWVINRGAQTVKGRKPWLLDLYHPAAITLLQG